MRPRFVLALVVFCVLILGGAFLLKQHRASTSGPPASAKAVPPAPATASNALAGIAPPPAPAATNIMTPEQRQDAITAETDRLQEWSTSSDPGDLANILADLNNPEKEVRAAAIEATKQFGSASAIPTLKAAAANTTDPEEQTALLEAADFLSLPSITDAPDQPKTPEQIQADAQQQAARDARRQAQMQRHSQNQNSQPPVDPNSPAGPGP